MNHLTVQPATMSSLEIAELTGKRHDNVMRDIRKMLEELYGRGGLLKFEDTYRNEQNRQLYDCFKLPRREVEILLTGYSIPLRAKAIDRLHELEAGAKSNAADPAPPNFSNPAEAARAWAAEWEQHQALALESRKLAAESAAKPAELRVEPLGS